MLDVSHLVHRFGPQLAVDDVCLSVGEGTIVGLVGRNGAGKTTTMRAIMGILRPLAGTITWDGRPVGPAERRMFGYMPEERGLYPQMPIEEQVRYFARLHGLGPDEARQAAQGWLARLGLADRASDKLIALSHGNQQRAQLAVALVHNPRLLVLDEPFAGLDPAAVDALSDVLQARAADGVAVLFSSHQLELVERLCKQVVIIDQGRVLAHGPLDQLRSALPQHLRVVVDAPPGWVAGLAGVRVEREDQEGMLLLLDPGVDPQDILLRAMEAGPVSQFGFESGHLSDLYRHLVTE